MLLAGTAAYLYGSKGKTTADVSRFLISRGLWLVFAEFVIVRFAWMFTFQFDYLFVQVIFAIGCSMIVLGLLVFLPFWMIGAASLLMIFGHNAFDSVSASSLGQYEVLWHFLHQPARLHFGDNIEVHVLYPLVPWIGVLAAGYLLGSLYLQPEPKRVRFLIVTGLILTVGFFVLRYLDLYGNPVKWELKADLIGTIISFLSTEKYPPSLLFLMMTLGPALIFLGLTERAYGKVVDFFVVFGRVPFFFYVLHLLLVHFLAVLYAFHTGVGLDLLFGPITADKPPNYGVSIWYLYLIWPVVIAILYLPCKWFSKLKQRRKDWWLSYV